MDKPTKELPPGRWWLTSALERVREDRLKGENTYGRLVRPDCPCCGTNLGGGDCPKCGGI